MGYTTTAEGPERIMTSESTTGVRLVISSIPSENVGENRNYWGLSISSSKFATPGNENGSLGSFLLGTDGKDMDAETAERAMHRFTVLANMLDDHQLFEAAAAMTDYGRDVSAAVHRYND